MRVTASAPGKIILFGEHFVVFGEPAIACAVDLRAKVSVEKFKEKVIHIEALDLGCEATFPIKGGKYGFKGETFRLRPIYTAAAETLDRIGEESGLNISVMSKIPVASGLGSSAAIAVATVKAVSELFNASLPDRELFNLALEAERIVHANPSGIDPAVAMHGGVIMYSKRNGVRRLNVKGHIPIIVGNTGVRRSTGKLVQSVGKLRDIYPEIVDPIIKLGGELCLKASKLLEVEDLKGLGSLMNINHGLLSSVGVSSLELERLVYRARGAGALGAKLTGAGGGGCIIALSTPDRAQHIAERLREVCREVYISQITSEGVKIDEKTCGT